MRSERAASDGIGRLVMFGAALCASIALLSACASSDAPNAATEPIPTEAPAAPKPSTMASPTPTAMPPEPTATSAPTPTAEPPTATAAELVSAIHDDLTSRIQDAVNTWRESNGAPAVSAAVLVPGLEPIAVASGVRDLDTNEPVTTDDFFRIASITKPMTAAVILQLVEEGLIELDEPVSTYLGDWLGDYEYEDDITVRQLMDHTNGLIEYAFDIGFYIEAAQRQDQPYTPEEILEFLSRQEPLFAPGTEYQYETGGFVAAGLLIELLTGNPANEEMRSRIFDPAGAVDIYLTPQEFPPEPVVNAYARAELYDALVLLPGVDDAGQTINGEPVIDVLSGEQAVLQSAGWTGGGNEAQVQDVAAIFGAMFDGTLLKPESVEAMITPALSTSNYGLGIDVGTSNGEVVYSHGGGVPGFRSQAGYLPDMDVAYAFSASLIPLPDGGGVDQLRDAITEIVLSR